jgi:hypothetical protein
VRGPDIEFNTLHGAQGVSRLHMKTETDFRSIDRLCGVVVKLLATDPEIWVRFPVLPDFLRSSGSGMEVQLSE